MTAGRRLGAGALLVTAFGAQVLLQQPLGRANQVRSARKLHTAPSSLAFRLAAGGVRAAAADALWLSVLPKLGRSWVDPERKARWIEAVTGVMVDANPRALNPVIYAGYYLEFIRKRHPAIERTVLRALEAREKTPFEEPRAVNADSWQLCEVLGMNMYLYGSAEEKAEALDWLRRAAAQPMAPTILPDFVEAIARRSGSPLEGWSLWLIRAAGVSDPGLRAALYAAAGEDPPGPGEPADERPDLRDHYLREADRTRLGVLRKWAAAFEEREGRWPASVDELLGEAPAAEREAWERRPARRAALAADLRLFASTRDLEIPSLTRWTDDDQRAQLRLMVDHFEATRGRRPRSMEELLGAVPGGPDRPTRHGTRWELDPGSGEPEILPDPGDPRTRGAEGGPSLGR